MEIGWKKSSFFTASDLTFFILASRDFHKVEAIKWKFDGQGRTAAVFWINRRTGCMIASTFDLIMGQNKKSKIFRREKEYFFRPLKLDGLNEYKRL